MEGKPSVYKRKVGRVPLPISQGCNKKYLSGDETEASPTPAQGEGEKKISPPAVNYYPDKSFVGSLNL